MRQHTIPKDHPPITDDMTGLALGAHSLDLVDARVVTAYDIPDSDRRESLLLLDNGRVILVSCDPGYDDDLIQRTPDRWEVVFYDATDTDAGRAIKDLEPGQWL